MEVTYHGGERRAGAEVIRIESYGVRIDVTVDSQELVPEVLPLLPPGWRPAPDSFADAQFLLRSLGSGRYVVHDSLERVSQAVELDVALAFLESRIRGWVALWAPEHVFVHAGVVAANGRALVVPGDSFSGKTTLVAALVRAGADYLSDEFAVLDPAGLVHPYARPLPPGSVDGEQGGRPTAGTPADAADDARVPVALVAVTSYVPGVRWAPSAVSPGETAMALLQHAVPAQERPAEVLNLLRRVAEGCACVRGDRGEAAEVAPALLSLLDEAAR